MNGSILLDINTIMLTVAVITPRVLVCLSILPGFGLNTLTGMAKNAAAMAIALPAALPTFIYLQSHQPDFIFIIALIFKEAIIGMMFGVLMSVPIWVAQSIGSILDSQRSPIQIQANNSSVDRDASAIGAVMLQAVVLTMFQAGLFIGLTRLLIESYGSWPAYTMFPPFDAANIDIIIKRFGDMLWFILVYGAPVIIPLILIEFTFALIGVFASNLQVSFASSPIKSLTGLMMVLLYWRTFAHYVTGDFAQLLDLTRSLLAVRTGGAQ